MPRMFATLALVLIPALTAMAAPATKPVDNRIALKSSYAPGRYVLTQKTQLEQDITPAGSSAPQKQTVTQQIVAVMVVGEPAAGVKKMEMTFQSVQQKMVSGDVTLSFDSAGPENKQSPELAAAMKPLLKARLTLQIDAAGKIVSVAGLNELWDEMARDNKAAEPMAKQLKQQMGDEMVRDMVGAADRLLPDAPAEIGKNWTRDIHVNVPIMGAVRYQVTGTLQEVKDAADGRVAVIGIDGKFATERESKAELGGATIAIGKMDMKQTGTMLFNLTLGMASSVKIDQEGTMQAGVTGPSGKTDQLEVKQKVSSEITIVPQAATATASAPALVPASMPIKK